MAGVHGWRWIAASAGAVDAGSDCTGIVGAGMSKGEQVDTAMRDQLLSYIASLEKHVIRMKGWQEENTSEELWLRDDTAIAVTENIIRELRIISDGGDWRK